MSRHVLIIDDDHDVRAIVERTLAAAGFRITGLENGSKVDAVLSAGDIDLAIVDLVLPDIDGLTLTRSIRERYDIGIIILSALGGAVDRIVGLEVGADDYLAKPFEARELIARVRSVLRRLDKGKRAAGPGLRPTIFGFAGWRLNVTARTLTDPLGIVVPLTSGEYKLLEAFVTHANRVLSRDQFLDLVTSNDAPAFDRSIDVRVGRLRRKLANGEEQPNIIQTVRNGGYIFAGKVETI